MFQPNSVIAGRYQVIRLVGQGGMSNLYLAYDRKYNNAIVVVKEMTAAYSDPKEQQMAVELFHREAKLLASLNHRHIPKVYDYFQFAGKYYLSMEFIDGEDLAQKLEATKGPLPEQQVLEWGEQIATVLFYLHKHEPPIVFRDVKPSNIMLCEQGVKLIDFGIARHFDQAKKGDTMRIGSPGYAPPEQYAAQTDPRSDIYALGVTLHHALTGRDPTATQTPFLVPPARNLNPTLSEATAAMLARATQLDPADRYQNVLDMKNDIKQILSRGKQSTRVVGAPPAPPVVPATPVAAAAAAATAAAGGAAGAAAAAAAATAAATPGATPAAAGSNPANAANTASATPATTPAGSTAAGAAASQAATPAAAGNTKGRPWRGYLLVASVLLLFVGGAYLIGPQGRAAALDKLRSTLGSLTRGNGGPSGDTISTAIEEALRNGDARDLLSIFGNGQMANLSADKQALYHLNLLAAEVSRDKSAPGILHVLYPESLTSQQQDRLFRTCASALAAVNGVGGLDKQLLVILPKPYAAGRLNATVGRLWAAPLPQGGQRLLVLDSDSQAAQLSPESRSQPLLVLGDASPGEGVGYLSTLNADTALAELFPLEGSERRMLWAASPTPPAGEFEKVQLDGSQQSWQSLLARSASEQATVVASTSQVSGLEGLGEQGRLLLLAVGSSALPKLAAGAKAEALVLGSPVRHGGPGVPLSSLTLSPTETLEPSEARLFDAIVLAASSESLGYSGITVTRTTQGKEQPGVSTRFRWTASGWIPVVKS